MGIKKLLTDGLTMATVLHAICLNRYGSEFQSWEPEALELQIQEDFGVQISEAGANRLHCLIGALASDSFFNDWVAFSAVCSSLSSEDGEMEIQDSLIAAQLAWGVTEVLLNESHEVHWGSEVRKYAGIIQVEDGLVKPLDILSFAIIPDKYNGSSYSADLEQEQVADSDHRQIIDEFLQDQARLLFSQLGE